MVVRLKIRSTLLCQYDATWLIRREPRCHCGAMGSQISSLIFRFPAIMLAVALAEEWL